MKFFLLVALILVYQNGFGQGADTSDIFEEDKNYDLILKPEVEKNINKAISLVVNKKLQDFKVRNNSDLKYLTDRLKEDEIKFAEDTIRIQEFLSEYYGYSMANTTMGMNWGESKRLDAYDKL